MNVTGWTAAACALALAATPAAAQEEPELLVELNAAETEEQACKLSFLIVNGTARTSRRRCSRR